MSDLSYYAKQLATLYQSRKNSQVALSHLERDAQARRLALTPAEGWPGKNEEARRLAQDRAFASDPELQKIETAQADRRDKLADAEAEIEALQELASAERWKIRARLADALSARYGERPPASGEIEAAAELQADLELEESLPF